MSWFTRKKQNINKNPKKDLPSDLWIKCPNCGEILYKPELEANNFICHHCNFHFPITSEHYQDLILDKKKENLFSDITSIDTLGFRGEALASIASVAQVSIISNDERSEGSEINVIDGNLCDVIPAPKIDGTQITIKDLFYNTPARKKFLKTLKS